MNDRSPDYTDLIAAARSIGERTDLAARWILDEFDAYYVESRNIPNLAKAAFERLDPASSLHLSLRRLSVYSVSVARARTAPARRAAVGRGRRVVLGRGSRPGTSP